MRKLFLILMAVLACTWSMDAFARTIHGSVLDAANNEPLIGATIMPIGGGQGTSADIDGNFTLNIPDNVKKLNVSYVGYETQTVNVANNLTIHLKSTTTSLDDVVVVAYGTATKESLTGSVAVVDSKEIDDRPVTSVTAALEGNAPGVQVNNTYGTPGSSPSIVIRGFNTINGVSTPLYVVDGVPYDGAINDLNPADVESMSVLKDAASSALYGAKGANGVVLITTKKAKKVGKVDVTLQIGQGTFTRGLPRYETMGANDWMETAFTGYVNGIVKDTPGLTVENAIETARGGAFITNYAKNNIYGRVDANGVMTQVPNGELFDENGKLVPGIGILPGYTDLDWWDSIAQTGYRQEYNLNAAGATDKFNIFASVGYMKESGYMIKSDFERYTGRLNANYNPTSYLQFGVNLAATNQVANYNTSTGSATTENPFNVLGVAPIFPYYEHNETTGAINYDGNGKPIWNEAAYLLGSNPGYTQRLDNDKMNALLADANVYGTAILPYGFEVTVRGAMHRDKTTEGAYTNNVYGSGVAGNGLYKFLSSEFGSHTFMQQLNWAHDYADHHVDLFLDHENYQITSESTILTLHDQIFSDIMNVKNFNEYSSHNGGLGKETSESYLARARYNYDQKYFGEFHIRRDGSSRFSKDSRWGTFWSVGGSWVISKEKFMENLPWIDYAKFRAAYGSVGNNASAGNYAYWSLYAIGKPFMGSGSTIAPSQIALNNVRWEATKTLDLGIEASLFNSRLNFTAGYFNKRNTDLLMYVNLPYSLGTYSLGQVFSGGIQSVLDNIGTMQNIGWEVSVNGDIIRTPEFTWSASIDASFIKNKVIKLPKGNDLISGSRITAEGKPLNSWYLYTWGGVDQMNGQALLVIDPNSYEVYSSADNDADRKAYYDNLVASAEAAGALVTVDGVNYTTTSQYATQDYHGTPLPTVYGSFGTSATWKGFSLGVLFTYSLGGKTYDSNYAGYMNVGANPTAMHKDLFKAWAGVPEGMTADSPNRVDPNGVPQLNYTQLENGSNSTRWLTKSDYLCLKNINFSYAFPKKWLNPLQLQGLSLGVTIDNLFTVTARKGMNPQQNFFGSQDQTFVTARVFSFQLTARF